MVPTGCLETCVTNFMSKLRNILEERRSYLHHGKSLKSHIIGEYSTGVKAANVTTLFLFVRRPLPLQTPIPHVFIDRRINAAQGKERVHHFQETLEFSGEACWQRPQNAKQTTGPPLMAFQREVSGPS